MPRNITIALSAAVSLVLAGPAAAANFGFVRWPDYLDTYIYFAAVVTVLGLVAVKMQLPKGLGYTEVPKDQRTTAMFVTVVVMGIAFVALMGMVFVGMGLQRAAE